MKNLIAKIFEKSKNKKDSSCCQMEIKEVLQEKEVACCTIVVKEDSCCKQ